jgi:predicted aspartyl protease
METVAMGKVLVTARIENLIDLYECERGRLAAEQARAVEVSDAPVDTGATMLSLPRRLVRQLGLSQRRSRPARTAGGPATFAIFEPVRLTIQGRDCAVEVAELPDDCPVLIGQIPLESLDFVVDPVGQRLIGNPDHGGQQMIDVF